DSLPVRSGSFAALSRFTCQSDSELGGRFQSRFRSIWSTLLSPLCECRIQRSGKAVDRQEHLLEITCQEVWRELTTYMEGDVTAEMRERIAQHLSACAHCRAVYDGSRNIVQLLGNGKAFELPSGFSRRLYRRLQTESRSGQSPSSVE